MDAAVAALLGAAVGAIPGLLTPLWTQRAESRRARLKLAVELGREDFEFQKAQMEKKPGGGALPPVALYVTYHAEFLSALERKGFGPAEVRRIEQAMSALQEAFPRRY